MRIYKGASPFVVDIPNSVEVIGHQVEPVNVWLQSLNIEMLEIPVTGWKRDRKPVSCSSAIERRPQALDEGGKVIEVDRTPIAIISSRIFPRIRIRSVITFKSGEEGRGKRITSQCQHHRSHT